MKKNLLLAFCVIVLGVISHAQIPNAGFENWTGGNPDHWLTGNSGQATFITQSSTAHEGSSAARSDVVTIFSVSIASPLLLGDNGEGTHTSTAPAAIHGWYILNSVSGDYFWAVAGMLDNNGNDTGAGETNLDATSVYKEFGINLYYSSGSPNGDSLLLDFAIGNDNTFTPHDGSYFIVDDLSFGSLVGIDDAAINPAGLESICPNPASSRSEIIYNIASSGVTTLNIYDATGRLVKSLVNEKQSPGRYKALTNVSDLPSGIYFCKLSTSKKIEVQQLVVQH